MQHHFMRGTTPFLIRTLLPEDAQNLGIFFDELDEATRHRFGPHPLNRDFAIELCSRTLDTAFRFIIHDKQADKIAGYMILEKNVPDYELDRYKNNGVFIPQNECMAFAPCMHPTYQNGGIAGTSMPFVLDFVRSQGIHYLILLGGTQDTNVVAQKFYQKFGFIKYGGYQTEVFNHDMMLSL